MQNDILLFIFQYIAQRKKCNAKFKKLFNSIEIWNGFYVEDDLVGRDSLSSAASASSGSGDISSTVYSIDKSKSPTVCVGYWM